MPLNRLLLGYFATLGDFKTKIPMAVDREEEEREGEVEPDGAHARRRWAASAWGQPATGGPWWWWGGETVETTREEDDDCDGAGRRRCWSGRTAAAMREEGSTDRREEATTTTWRAPQRACARLRRRPRALSASCAAHVCAPLAASGAARARLPLIGDEHGCRHLQRSPPPPLLFSSSLSRVFWSWNLLKWQNILKIIYGVAFYSLHRIGWYFVETHRMNEMAYYPFSRYYTYAVLFIFCSSNFLVTAVVWLFPGNTSSCQWLTTSPVPEHFLKPTMTVARGGTRTLKKDWAHDTKRLWSNVAMLQFIRVQLLFKAPPHFFLFFFFFFIFGFAWIAKRCVFRWTAKNVGRRFLSLPIFSQNEKGTHVFAPFTCFPVKDSHLFVF